MQPGDTVADRFVIESRAGAGGMGEVFRARDRQTGEAVALEVLLDAGADAGCFAREARAFIAARRIGASLRVFVRGCRAQSRLSAVPQSS